MSVQFEVDAKFDENDKRQYINNQATVFHCHHYISLFTQLADDAKLFSGEKHLYDTAEETFYQVLNEYMKSHPNVSNQADKVSIAEQYFSFVGLGQLTLTVDSDAGGKAEMPFSHVDEGWKKKWGEFDKSINFIGQGFIAAAFAMINGQPVGSYHVTEVESQVCGADKSTFTIEKN
ncbi:hypothetical protein [Aliikangiella maris]|uniref:Uncharacterized protein n=2 Tax=Aliikangiella maris TaxID=3162458 RepID=A0ABV3MMR9_9GAMM